MKYRTVTRLAVTLSIALFCIGAGFYGLTQLSREGDDRMTDLSAFIPEDCAGVIEADNIDRFMNEYPTTAYAPQLDTLHKRGLVEMLWIGLERYGEETAHALSTQISHVMVSIHTPGSARDLVAFFAMGREGRKLFLQTIRKMHPAFGVRKESYRGREIEVFPLEGGDYIAACEGKGFLALSFQKRLIEKVIDAQKDGTSLKNDKWFANIHKEKKNPYITFYGRTPALPLLMPHGAPCWSSFNLHLNSEVFYLTGTTSQPDSCNAQMRDRLHALPSINEDSLLIVQGNQAVDSCLNLYARRPHSLFNECVANLSPDASFILVADMDKVTRHRNELLPFLPPFIRRAPELFRPFILSMQLTEPEGHLSHILILTYKE